MPGPARQAGYSHAVAGVTGDVAGHATVPSPDTLLPASGSPGHQKVKAERPHPAPQANAAPRLMPDARVLPVTYTTLRHQQRQMAGTAWPPGQHCAVGPGWSVFWSPVQQVWDGGPPLRGRERLVLVG